MSSDLLCFRPENVVLPASSKRGMQMVTGDVYNIAERLAAVSKRLFVVVHDNHPKPFVVMERCDDGMDRLVKRYEALDARIVDDVKYMLHVPFEKRMKMAELEEEKAKAERERAWAQSESFDYFATEMRREMKRSNMIDPKYDTNYPLVPQKRSKSNS